MADFDLNSGNLLIGNLPDPNYPACCPSTFNSRLCLHAATRAPDSEVSRVHALQGGFSYSQEQEDT